MTSYLALLRGINVSGRNSIRMPALRDSLSRLGFGGVQTYLHSGNIVFRTAKTNEALLAAKIRAAIAEDFGFEVPVLVMSMKDLGQIVNSNSLRPKTCEDDTLFHCTFVFQPISQDVFQSLNLPAAAGERAVLMGAAILLHCPHGYGRTKLNNNFFERVLGVAATTRNWRTMLALQALATAPCQ
jgi:uncharacterized protein (DUF1697 family)